MATLLQFPGAYNLAYGPNIITTTGITVGQTRYVVQLWDGPPAVGASLLMATLKQSPNAAGTSIFDVQTVLQSYVAPSGPDIDELGITDQPNIFATADLELAKYYVRFGTENAAGLITYNGSAGPYYVLGGKKPYFAKDWSWSMFAGTVKGDSESAFNCTTVNEGIIPGSPLSDWTTHLDYPNNNQISYEEIEAKYGVGSVPSQLQNANYGGFMDADTISNDDYRTKSFLNVLLYGNPAPDLEVKGIEGFRYIVYNGASQVSDQVIPNILANGGGPNADVGDGITPTNEFKVITAPIGPKNINNMQYYTDSIGTQFSMYIPTADFWTHYFVYPVAWTPGGDCPKQISPYADAPLMRPQVLFNVNAGGLCNDLDYDPIQISWMNQYGFRDYYTFRKKHERSVTVSRNLYTASTYNPDAQTWSSDPEARGATTYSQELEEEWIATTGYLEDNVASFLEGLWTSPDVRVKLPQEWYDRIGIPTEPFIAAVITSNKYTEKTYRKDKLFQYEIKFKLANNLKSQRG